MPDFIRVTWIDIDRDKERDVTQEQKLNYQLDVNLKESENGALIQRKATISLKLNEQFDSHLYQGRHAQMVLSKLGGNGIGETSVEITRVSEVARNSLGHSTVIKLPLSSGEFFVKLYIKLYAEATESSGQIDPSRPSLGVSKMPNTGLKRRNAKRDQITKYIQMGHEFHRNYFSQPTNCSVCEKFLWGVGQKQGFQCAHCRMAVHTEHIEKVFTKCLKGTMTEQKSRTPLMNINIPHKWETKTFTRPTMCKHCGQLIFGFYKQGVYCKDCKMASHKKCMDQIANTCGTDVKRLAELLQDMPGVGQTVPVPVPSFTDTDMDIYQIPAPQEEDEDVYAMPSYYQKPPSPTAPTPVERKTTIMKRDRVKNIMNINNFKYEIVLGRGSFGKVMLTSITGCSNKVAIKAMKKHTVQANGDVLATAVEKRMLELAWEHPYLAHLVATCQGEGYLYFIMEFLSGGDLMHWIQKGPFSRSQSVVYGGEIALGLEFLHGKKIVYRDLKLDNVLLDADGHCRIADFGMCRENVSDKNKCATFCGTPEYLAPEIIRKELYTFSVDWWSYGVLVYEMLTGMSPFSGEDEDSLYRSIQYDRVQYLRMDPEARDFCTQLFERRPKERLGIKGRGVAQLKSHSFFKSINWEKLSNKEVKAPFVPRSNGMHFDQEFTDQRPRLTKIDRSQLAEIDDKVFENFDCINPHAHEILEVKF